MLGSIFKFEHLLFLYISMSTHFSCPNSHSISCVGPNFSQIFGFLLEIPNRLCYSGSGRFEPNRVNIPWPVGISDIPVFPGQTISSRKYRIYEDCDKDDLIWIKTPGTKINHQSESEIKKI